MNIYEKIFKKHGLSKTQQEIINIVGRQKSVLEIGSSTGYMSKAFLENGCQVDVVETNWQAVKKIPASVRKIFNQSIEDPTLYHKLGKYEFIVMADVLEHLVDPGQVLRGLLKVASANTKLLLSLPNIACWAMRKQLFFKGEFEYQDSGLLDKTHLHFYTVQTLPKILSQSGWQVEDLRGTITRLPLEGLISKIPIFGWFFKKVLYPKLVEKFKNLSYYHFLVVTSKK